MLSEPTLLVTLVQSYSKESSLLPSLSTQEKEPSITFLRSSRPFRFRVLIFLGFLKQLTISIFFFLYVLKTLTRRVRVYGLYGRARTYSSFHTKTRTSELPSATLTPERENRAKTRTFLL